MHQNFAICIACEFMAILDKPLLQVRIAEDNAIVHECAATIARDKRMRILPIARAVGASPDVACETSCQGTLVLEEQLRREEPLGHYDVTVLLLHGEPASIIIPGEPITQCEAREEEC